MAREGLESIRDLLSGFASKSAARPGTGINRMDLGFVRRLRLLVCGWAGGGMMGVETR